VVLDIQMPEIKGTDFAKLFPVNIIFTTLRNLFSYTLEGI
jgi:hypothetical protein